MGLFHSSGPSESFVPFPISRRDELVRLQLERTVMHPLVLSHEKNDYATIFEHVSCAGHAADVFRAMRSISRWNGPSGEDCVFSYRAADGALIVCMWLVRRRIALSASIQSARDHPKRLFVRMRKWMAAKKPCFFVVQSSINVFSLFAIAADFGIRTIKLCDNSSVHRPSSFVGERILGLRIEMCDPASTICEESRDLLGICDEITAPIASLAYSHVPLRDSPWHDRGIQLRIRLMCSDLRSIVIGRCGSPSCILALRSSIISLRHPQLHITCSSTLPFCHKCQHTIRIASHGSNSY